MSQVRLQKFLAEAGLGSRRSCEQLILAGRVHVNGSLIRELGTKVHPDRDVVTLDGQEVARRHKLYVALHKPPGYLCTRRQETTQKLIGQLLPAEWEHLFCIGRLDGPSEGLIFLTNDGEFSNQIAHPRYGILKVYHVGVEGKVTQGDTRQMVRGVTDQGQRLRAKSARILSSSNSKSVLELTLAQGKNREIRRLLGALGFKILRLKRIQIGPVKLGELPPGKWRTLTEPEIKSLLH